MSAAIRAGDDLHQVAVGVGEIDAASAVIVVDLPRPGPAGIGPVRHAAPGDAAEYDVEIFLADQERIVLDGDVAVGLGEVEGHAVVRSDDEEPPESRRGRQAEYLSEETCRPLLIAARNDRVVELHAHSRSFSRSSGPSGHS